MVFFSLIRLQTSCTIRPRRRLISNGSKPDLNSKSISIEINTRKKFLHSFTPNFRTTPKRKMKDPSCKIRKSSKFFNRIRIPNTRLLNVQYWDVYLCYCDLKITDI